MRIRWRGMELPGRVVPDHEVNTDFYGRFVIEPFEQGFGTTIGNSLRRVLLSSLEGAAVTTVSTRKARTPRARPCWARLLTVSCSRAPPRAVKRPPGTPRRPG